MGAVVVANLPKLYRRFGLSAVTKAGGCAGHRRLRLGGGAGALAAPCCDCSSRAGWAAMGAAAVNQIVSPWFIRTRPAALSMAYNGASIGGVVSPLWVAAIALLRFPWRRRDRRRDRGDGLAARRSRLVETPHRSSCCRMATRSRRRQSRSRRHRQAAAGFAALARFPVPTLAAGMALGLFAQIGLIAHLSHCWCRRSADRRSGDGGGNRSGIVGRTLVGWLMPAGADRRLVACASYVVQIAGALAFFFAAGTNMLCCGRRHPVRSRHRQCDVVAAADRAGRIHSEDVPASSPSSSPSRRERTICTRRLRAYARARFPRDIHPPAPHPTSSPPPRLFKSSRWERAGRRRGSLARSNR